MNFQTSVVLPPIKVLVVSPLTPSGQMICSKIMSGFVFGENRFVDLILLVYSNEIPKGERLKLELIQCAYSCYNTITVSSDLPRITDADVFCFLTNFYNPNKIDLEKITDDQFNTLNLIIKIANNISSLPTEKEHLNDNDKFPKKETIPEIKPRKPIFMADGLAVMDILFSMSKNLAPDMFFCPTVLPDISKTVLGSYLKVKCNVINRVLVWAANDEVFHVEVEEPMIFHDKIENESFSDCDGDKKNRLQSSYLDHTQFSPSWMKKEFIEKVSSFASKNPYGCIFRASLFARALKTVWTSCTGESGQHFYCNVGVVSDGSLGTVKGLPYVLPLAFSGGSWSVDKSFAETAHLQNEIKRINKTVKQEHQILIPPCKRFLQENVITHEFIPVLAGSSTENTSVSSAQRSITNE